MPCRLQPHIWISDDALAQAYRRFANTCSVGPGHGHSRRHGSNVPGPLEARKRQAKRRMVGLAMAGAPGSAVPDFGALFAPGSFDMTSLWKPPASSPSYPLPPYPSPPPPPQTPVLLQESTCPANPCPPSRQPRPSIDELCRMLGPCETLSSVRQAHSRLFDGQDHVSKGFSKAAFRCLLDHAEPQHIIDFLQSDLNLPQAYNTHKYFKHICTHQSHISHLNDYLQFVCDKIALDTIAEKELVDILYQLPSLLQDGFTNLEERDGTILQSCRLLHTSLVAFHSPQKPPDLILKALFSAYGSVAYLPGVVQSLLDIDDCLSRSVMVQNGGTLYSVLCSLVKAETEDFQCSSLLRRLLARLPSDAAPAILHSVTAEFLTHLRTLEKTGPLVASESMETPEKAEAASDGTQSMQRLVSWLGCLRDCYPQARDPLSPISRKIYRLLASYYHPSHLTSLFGLMGPVEISLAMLHYWIKPTITGGQKPLSAHDMQVTNRRSTSSKAAFQTYGVTYTLSRSRQTTNHRTAAKGPQVFKDIASSLKEYCTDPLHANHVQNGAYIHLLTLLRNHDIKNDFWLAQIYYIMRSMEPPNRIYNLFRQLISKKIHIPYPVASSVMQLFIEHDKPYWAFRIFNRRDANQWLSETPELILALIDHGYTRPGLLFGVLNTPEFVNSTPMALRTVSKNPLIQDRVNLIQYVAYALAKSPHLTARQAFRRVTDCLHYLEDRGAELSSLMSRALVFAGVTRPLKDGDWVSTVRFGWVLDHVRKLEGEEVAQQLDEAAWTLRGQNLQAGRDLVTKVDEMDMEANQIAWEYAKKYGHQRRWKRMKPLYRFGAYNGPRRTPGLHRYPVSEDHRYLDGVHST